MIELKKGLIVTNLPDLKFLATVMWQWIQIEPILIEGKLEKIKETEKEIRFSVKNKKKAKKMPVILRDGFSLDIGDGAQLIKVANGQWKVEGMNSEEMEEFVEGISGNME